MIISVSPYIIILITFCSTFIGGLLALRYGKHIHWLNALSAGILLGAAFFELLPEAINLAGNVRLVFAVTVGAFIFFYFLQRLTILHACHEHTSGKQKQAHNHTHSHKHSGDTKHMGVISASGLALHSFLDGSAIGLGFAIDPIVGLTIAVAIIAHDFGDGVSTVTLMLRHKNTKAKTLLLLSIDALAPVLGALIFMNLSVPGYILGLMLAFFAGFFLYLSTSDLLPEAQRETDTTKIILVTALGAALMYGITLFVG